MDTAIGDDQADEPAKQVKSVAAGILGEFFDVLANEDGLADIAAGLGKTVLDDGIFAEPAIRATMFPEAS
ncbi:hypothetical protein [Sphingobium sp. AP50]|uniref:hypothetical protein n=1 Tax=Sphingobium sp. AP50 TaxID=1884369 RepID=UPI000B891320|nr:hypothetical protein [Sphingobium sp. AP50]